MNKFQIVTWTNIISYGVVLLARFFDSPKLMFFGIAIVFLCFLDELIMVFLKKLSSKQERNECVRYVILNVLLIAAFIAHLFEDDFITRLFA